MTIRAVLPVIAAVLAFGQTAPLEFEVASVKPSPEGAPDRVSIGVHVDGAQVRCSYLSLKDYIRIAYQVKLHQIVGPEWIAGERYDITAKLPAGATQAQVPEMLKTLLANRFHLKTHQEMKEFPVYALIVAKGGLKMKESPPDADSEDATPGKAPINVAASGSRAGTMVDLGHGSSFAMANNRFEGKKMTMASLADMLGRYVDRPVIDMTDLKGNYDFGFDVTADDFRTLLIRSAVAAGVSLPPEALRLLDGATDESLHAGLQALGLKLEPRKAPIEVVAIDHAEKTPVEN